MRASFLLLPCLACAEPEPGEDAATVRIVVMAAADGEITVEEEVDPDDVLHGASRFAVGPLRPGGEAVVELPEGWRTLVAHGELEPHPGYGGDTGDSTPFEDGWRDRREVWVSVDAPPSGNPVHVRPGGDVEVLRFRLRPACGCCDD